MNTAFIIALACFGIGLIIQRNTKPIKPRKNNRFRHHEF